MAEQGMRIGRRSAFALAAVGLVLPRAGRAQPVIAATQRAGANLYELVVSPSTGTVYVAAAGGRGGEGPKPQIVLLDAATLEPRGAIDLDVGAFGLGLNDRTQTLYATNTTTGTVSVIDLKQRKVVATPQHGEKAHLREAVVDEAANRVYVTAYGGGREEGPSAIWVIDGAKAAIDHVITEGLETGGITGIALDPARNRLFATAMRSNEVVEVDLAAKRAVRRFAAGGEGTVNLALDAAGERLFATNQRTGNVAVLNPATGAVIRSIATGEGALGIAFDRERNRIFVANRRAGTTSVIDGRSLEIVASLKTGTHPNTVATDPRTGFAYVTNKRQMSPRGQPPVEDPNGDTVSLIRL